VASVERHIDLVVKQRIRAVAGIDRPQSTRRFLAPRALHYGVWELPISGHWPTKHRWPALSGWLLCRKVRRAASEAATYHLVLDASALVDVGPRALRAVTRLLRRVSELRKQGFIDVETLGMAAARLSNVPALSPQCSILRRAA
jgi:hypothetical protein